MNLEAQKLKQLGNNAYKKRDFAIALENYGKAIDQEPTEITYYLNIAAVHLEMKNFTECVNTCNKAIEVGRENGADFKLIANALARMGKAYRRSGDLKNAKIAIEMAQIENNSAEYRNALSEIESAMKDCHVEDEKTEDLYKVVPIEGKGFGCVALKDIKKGTLIVKEKSPIVVKIDNSKLVMRRRMLESFFSMTKEDQEEFLTLNKICGSRTELSNEEIQNGHIIIKEFVKTHPDADQEKLIDIVCIFSSNMFASPCWNEDIGDWAVPDTTEVYLKASKFNHSCNANAKTFPMDDYVMEIRALANIMVGQEITTNYLQVNDMKGMNYRARQQVLLTKCSFECICERCQKEALENDV